MTTQATREKYGLPFRPFLYTLDQIADILALDGKEGVKPYVFFEGRSTGVAPRDKLVARNIAPADCTPDWRVEELELIRWFRTRGFRGLNDRHHR